LCGLAFSLVALLAPIAALADSSFPNCDDVNSYTNYAGGPIGGAACRTGNGSSPNGFSHWRGQGTEVDPGERTLYGFDVDLSEVSANMSVWIANSDTPSEGDDVPGETLCEDIPNVGGGIEHITLPTPFDFHSGQVVRLNFGHHADCFASGGGNIPALYGDSGGSNYEFKLVLDWTPNNTLTRIDSIAPANNATTTTGVAPTYSATGYVNTNDFNSTTYVRWAWSAQNLSNSACADVICAFNGGNGIGLSDTNAYTTLLTSDGAFSVSTTSPVILPNGYYNLTTSIVQPVPFWSTQGILSWLGFASSFTQLVSTTTSFAVGTTTPYEDLLHSTLGYSSNTSTTTQAVLDSCSPLSGSFNIGYCTNLLFTPNQSDLQAAFNTVTASLLTRMPWGYVTRAVNILTSSSTPIDLPSISVAIPISAVASTTLTFNETDMLNGGATILNNATDPVSGKNLRQVVEPFIQGFIALSVVIIIFFDVMAMGRVKKGKR